MPGAARTVRRPGGHPAAVTTTPPESPPLAVHPEDVARRIGLTVPLEPDQWWALTEAIRDVQGDVERYLRRPVTPRTYVDRGLWPNRAGWAYSHEPVLRVLTVDAETDPLTGAVTGLFTVTYVAGIDAAADPEYRAIYTYIARHSAAHDLVAPLAPLSARQVSSLSVDGQSVTYANTAAAGAGDAGGGPSSALPTLKSLERWRPTLVFQRRGEPFPRG